MFSQCHIRSLSIIIMPLAWLALSSLGLLRTVSQNFKARSCKCQFNGTSSGLCQLCFCARPLSLRVLIFHSGVWKSSDDFKARGKPYNGLASLSGDGVGLMYTPEQSVGLGGHFARLQTLAHLTSPGCVANKMLFNQFVTRGSVVRPNLLGVYHPLWLQGFFVLSYDIAMW